MVLGNGESNDFLEISKFSSKDAHNYKAYNQMLSEFVEIVNPYLDQSPRIWNYEVFKKILRHFRVGKRNIIPEFYNFLTAPASTILNQWFGKKKKFKLAI